MSCLLLALVALAAAASSCGAGSDARLAAYLGAWERVVAGEPDPGHALVVERSDDGATLTFVDPSGRQSQGFASFADGVLTMEMPLQNGILDGASGLRVSLDAGGQLVVDRVLGDGTSEPVWVYDRAPSVAPVEP